MAARSRPVGVNRAVYDPAIRDVIVKGELSEMKSMLIAARKILRRQGDLKAAISRLEHAIKRAER